MKRPLGLLAFFFFLASHVWAQDVDFGAFGDAGTLLGPSAPAGRGAVPDRGVAAPVAPPDRLVRLREALAKAEMPMTKEQESELNKLLDAEIPAMRRTLQTHGQQMLASRQASAAPAGAVAGTPAGAAPAAPAATLPPGPTSAAVSPATPAQPPVGARGTAPAGGPPNAALVAAALAARGAPPSSRVPADVLDALEVEMRQMNDALFGKIASSAALNTGQQAMLNKMARDQVRYRGGFDALRISMEDAGAPFTAEQLPRVQALFEDQKTARAALARESQGTPDPDKLKQLDRDTLTKVVGLLVPAQRTALLGLLRSQQ